MIIRPCAEFKTDLPDDGVEDESGWARYPGENVAQLVAEILRAQGFEVSAPIEDGEHGWFLELEVEKRRLLVQTTAIEDFILVVEDKTFRWPWSKQPHPAYLDVLRRLAAGMAAHPRLSKVRWFTSADLLSGKGGALKPVDG